MQTLMIVLGQSDPMTLEFRIRQTELAALWVDRMAARGSYPLDHPDRFYGFNSAKQEQDRAVQLIQQCIATINSHEHIIDRTFEYTQDCLNYLHNIFERYHGLLDQQNTDYWCRAPDTVRRALADLNLAVHRCETAMTSPQPRLVCTWFGMPKTHVLSDQLQRQHGQSQISFGTVYLNYCEIGKTAEDLAHDNDKYIADDAFRPFSHYSADFAVRFYDKDLSQSYDSIQEYIDCHRDFFFARGIENVYNINAQPLRFPVADLIYDGNRDQLLQQIALRQWVREVYIK
jgi:hypothetical protein